MVAPAAQAPPILGTDNHGRFILIMIVKQRQRMIPGRHDRSGKRSGGCGGKCAQKSAAGCRRTYRRITGRDRKSVGEGKRVSVSVELGGGRIIKTKKNRK